MDDHRGIVRRVNAGDQFEGAAPRGSDRAVAQGVERPLDVARGQVAAVVKTYSLAQMENPGQRIGLLPFLRYARLDIEMIVLGDQRIENQFIDALRLRVDALPWIGIH